MNTSETAVAYMIGNIVSPFNSENRVIMAPYMFEKYPEFQKKQTPTKTYAKKIGRSPIMYFIRIPIVFPIVREKIAMSESYCIYCIILIQARKQPIPINWSLI
ncbi:MAG: hypothetical protein V2I33_19375 [Kangiellaceae bacterium]|jgi:hypothetical protein|nr:hypothetical protein [Kangiellaceae bacterium]